MKKNYNKLNKQNKGKMMKKNFAVPQLLGSCVAFRKCESFVIVETER